MTSVTNTFSSGGTITASELNTNFSDLITLVTSVSNDQLAGGITWDKITDNNSLSWSNLTILEVTSGADLTSMATYNLPSAMTTVAKFRPVMKSGVEGFLCSIIVYVQAITADTASNPAIKFLLNGSTTLGGQLVNLSTSASFYLVANNDPVTNPLCTMSDGDYIEIQLGSHDAAHNPDARGLYVSFGMKYRLNA